MKTTAFVAGLVMTAALSSVACNKIPGLSKGDGGDEGGASSGPTGLSFLGEPFEGEISMNVVNTSGQKPQPMTVVLANKSPKVRLDLTGGSGASANPMLAGGGALLVDVPAKKGYLLVTSQKKAMVIDFEQMKAQQKAFAGAGAGKPGAATPDEGPPVIEKTGKKEVIAGYTCEDWKVKTKTSHGDMCVAEGLKIFDIADLGMGAPELTLASAAGANHFPLKVVTYNAQNVEQVRMEVTKVEKKALDASRFVVPADFQVIDINAMLGGLGAMGAPGGPGKLPPGIPPGFTTPPATKPH